MNTTIRRRVMQDEQKPKDIVNNYTGTITLPSLVYNFAFKLGAEYEVEAVYDNYTSGYFRFPPQNGGNFVVTSGSTSSNTNRVAYTGYFTQLPSFSRFMAGVQNNNGGKIRIKIIETIHPS